MPNVKNNAAAQETRRRLLEAAGEVFAARGLHAATIKEITDRAKVNVAAINYHFSDKLELYAAVIRHALTSKCASGWERTTGTREQRLRALIADMIDDLHAPSWMSVILAHEFAQPTVAITAVIDELIRPRVDCLNQLIRDLLGSKASREQVERAALSIVGQCFLFQYHRPTLLHLHPELLQEGQKESIINHIYSFSIHGLRGLRRAAPTRRRPMPLRS